MKSLLKWSCDKVVIRLWYMCEMKSIALNFVRWFLKNNSCDLLNEVVIRCEIVATNYLYSFIWRNFMIKYCIINCWTNVVNECNEWRIILYIWIKLSWNLFKWMCESLLMKVCDEVCDENVLKNCFIDCWMKCEMNVEVVLKLCWSSVT